MILAALMLFQAAPSAEAIPAFRDKPAFAFTCRAREGASALASYEYRVFLPVDRSRSQIPVRVELTNMEGVSKDMSSLRLDRGNLWVFHGPGSEAGKPPMFKVSAFAESLNHVLYDFQMIFRRSTSTGEHGVSQVFISPSEGRLRITKVGEEQTFPAECTHIDGGSVQ
ncbi:hypothetical protein ACFQPG_06405 [Sphingomonas sp. GCM10030256]|uniref:hypothetical protein n=1 Tax=Sphingomonas sp. GCM10030256 TaxID=3273427 RepID=UPI00360B970E